MNTNKTTIKSGQNQTALVKHSTKLFLTLLLTLFGLGVTNTWAALSAYESFNYTTLGNGTLAPSGAASQTTSGGYTGAWTFGGGATATLDSAGLAYPGLLTTNKALVINSVPNSYIQDALATTLSTGTYYISYLFKPGTSVNGGNNGAGFVDNGVQIAPNGSGVYLGVQAYGATAGRFTVNRILSGWNDNGPQLYQSATDDIVYGTTNLIVLKLTSTSANNWDGSVWVNPTAGTGTEPAASGTFTGISCGGAIQFLALLNRAGGNTLTFDEIRVGTTWSDAVSYTPPTPLNVAITSPANNTTNGNFFTITADASVFPGSVTNVVFYDNNTTALLGNDATAPYTYSANLAAGAHTLTAVAQASTGASVTSSVVNITVTNFPSLVVYEPFNYPLGAINNGTLATGSGLSGNWTFANNGSDSVVADLTYPGLPTANNALRQTQAGVRSFVSYAYPVGGDTKYFSFLFKNSNISGGEAIGTYFIGSGSTSLFVGFKGGFSGTQAYFGLGTVATANGTGGSSATMAAGAVPVTSTATNLIVVKVDFNTSGANDTVSLWINPTAGTNAPAGAANVVVNTIDVGVISGFGLNVEGGYSPTVDELRVGDTYGSVVGAPSPTVVTTVTVSTNQATTVSWTAYSTNVYQPQSSPDNSTWSNVGGQITGNTPNSLVDPANAAFYQVLEYYPVITEVVANGGLDYDNGLGGAQNWSSVQSQPPYWTNALGNIAPGCMVLAVTNATAAPNGSEMQQNTLLQGNPVTPGVSYNFSFWAKQISIGPSYVQQYNVQWLGSGSAFLGQSGPISFSGETGTWTNITQNNIVAPTGAETALIQILGTTGAVEGGYGEVLIDDVSLTATSFTGGPNILVPTVQSSMSFTATVKTNGITAGDATGTVNFKTNSIQLSINTVTGGLATSAGTSIAPPYTVTAIYSGDGTYLGSTGTLTVGGVGPSGPAYLTNSVSGSVLSLSWPASQGWRLQMQTNSLTSGLGTNWIYLTDGSLSSTNITVDNTKPTVFYRLTYP